MEMVHINILFQLKFSFTSAIHIPMGTNRANSQIRTPNENYLSKMIRRSILNEATFIINSLCIFHTHFSFRRLSIALLESLTVELSQIIKYSIFHSLSSKFHLYYYCTKSGYANRKSLSHRWLFESIFQFCCIFPPCFT